jgi:transposase
VEIEDHYALLLGIHSPWEISSVQLSMAANRVDIVVEYSDTSGVCPECGVLSPKHDDRESRTWRHLDTMQFATYLHASLPRVKCKTHAVKSVTAPWAAKNSRFTLLFESFAIQVIQASRSIEEARKLLKLNLHQVEAIKRRAVERGLARREAQPIKYLGIDEKQFRSGHQYITNLVDLEQGRILDVVEERKEVSCKTLLETALTPDQREQVTAVALDMWKAYANAVGEMLPQAVIVHDRFHVSQHLNQAVDQVRRAENRQLANEGVSRLKGTIHWWLYNGDTVKHAHSEPFKTLKHSNLKVARSWAIKEQFRGFWGYRSQGWARRYFERWYSWAIRCRLAPVKKVAKMLKNHLNGLLNYFHHRISNAVAEGLNSKIQTVKSNARGYRSFEGFRTSILFYCGKLDMLP